MTVITEATPRRRIDQERSTHSLREKIQEQIDFTDQRIAGITKDHASPLAEFGPVRLIIPIRYYANNGIEFLAYEVDKDELSGLTTDNLFVETWTFKDNKPINLEHTKLVCEEEGNMDIWRHFGKQLADEIDKAREKLPPKASPTS